MLDNSVRTIKYIYTLFNINVDIQYINNNLNISINKHIDLLNDKIKNKENNFDLAIKNCKSVIYTCIFTLLIFIILIGILNANM